MYNDVKNLPAPAPGGRWIYYNPVMDKNYYDDEFLFHDFFWQNT